MYEKDDLLDAACSRTTTTRRKRQKELDIRVIIGNPPYSVGQTSANDNNAEPEVPAPGRAHRARPTPHGRARTPRTPLRLLHPRDPLGQRPDRRRRAASSASSPTAASSTRNTADGLRKCLADEFSAHLRLQPARQPAHRWRERAKEGGKIFGAAAAPRSRSSLLVKNPSYAEPGADLVSTTSATI